MNRFLTIFLLLLAGGALATAISLRSCTPRESSTPGFVWDLDPEAVETIEVQSGGTKFQLRKRGSGWQFLDGDIKDQANPALIRKVLESASLLVSHDRIPGAEIDDRDELSEFGVRSPKRWIQFRGNDRTVRLLFGKDSAFEGKMYARVEGTHNVHLIDNELAKLVEGTPSRFRDPVLFSLDASQVDRFVIRGETGEIEIQHDATGWQITKPLTAPADDSLVEGFLRELLASPVLEIVADDTGDLGVFGIQEGRREIALFAEGRDTPFVVRFGAEPEGQPGEILAQFTARDFVARLPGATVNALAAGPDAFRDRRLLPVQTDLVDLIRITGPGGDTLEIRRSADGWQVQTAEELLTVSETAIVNLFSTLAETRVGAFTRREPESITKKVEFFSVLSENTPETPAGEYLIAGLELGQPAGGGLEARVSGRPGGVIVPLPLGDLLSPKAGDWAAPMTKSGPAGEGGQ